MIGDFNQQVTALGAHKRLALNFHKNNFQKRSLSKSVGRGEKYKIIDDLKSPTKC